MIIHIFLVLASLFHIGIFQSISITSKSHANSVVSIQCSDKHVPRFTWKRVVNNTTYTLVRSDVPSNHNSFDGNNYDNLIIKEQMSRINVSTNSTDGMYQSTLHINSTSCADDGEYICSSFTEMNGLQSDSVHLNIYYPPSNYKFIFPVRHGRIRYLLHDEMTSVTFDVTFGKSSNAPKMYLSVSYGLFLLPYAGEPAPEEIDVCTTKWRVRVIFLYNDSMSDYIVKAYEGSKLVAMSEKLETYYAALGPYKLIKVNVSCPPSYFILKDFNLCLAHQYAPLSWNDAKLNCEYGHLISFYNWTPIRIRQLSQFLSMNEMVLGSFWTSLNLINGSLVWETDDMAPYHTGMKAFTKMLANPQRKKRDLLPSNQTIPYDFDSFFDSSSQEICGYFNFMPPSLTLTSCNSNHTTLCLLKPQDLSMDQLEYASGCNSSEYSNPLISECLIVHRSSVDGQCPDGFCVRCPSGYQVFSSNSSSDYLYMLHAGKRFSHLNLWLGVERYVGRVMHVQHISNNETFRLDKFQNNHVLRMFISRTLVMEQGLDANRHCLAQNEHHFFWINCGSPLFYTVCSRPKFIPTGDEYVKMLFGADEITSDITKRIQINSIKALVQSIHCEPMSVFGKATLLLNGLSVNIAEVLSDQQQWRDGWGLAGCYQCALWSRTNAKWLYSNKLCMVLEDIMQFYLEIEATYKHRVITEIELFQIDIMKTYSRTTTLFIGTIYNNILRPVLTPFGAKVHLLHVTNTSYTQNFDILLLGYSLEIPTTREKSPNLYQSMTEQISRLTTTKFTNFLTDDSIFSGDGATNLIDFFTNIDDMELISLTNADYCLGFNYTSGNDTIEIGTSPRSNGLEEFEWLSSTLCETDKKPMAAAKCVGNAQTGRRYEVRRHAKCLSLRMFASHLDDLYNIVITDENVGEVLNDLKDLAMKKLNLDASDIRKISGILKNVATVTLNITTAEDFFSVYNKVLKTSLEQIQPSNDDYQLTNDLIWILDKYNMEVDLLGERTYCANYENIVVNLIDLDENYTSNTHLGSYSFVVPSDREWHNDRRCRSNFRQNSTNSSAGIYIPNRAVNRLLKSHIGKVRLSFSAQKQNLNFFNVTASLSNDSKTKTEAKFSHYLNSELISASLSADLNGFLRDDKIYTTYRPIKPWIVNTSLCVFWNISEKNWSTSGCRYSGYKDGYVQCECNHLTHFAVLMSPVELNTKIDAFALRVVTIIGLALSIAGLSLTLITFIVFPKLRISQPRQALFCLAITLICAYIVFLAGINQVHTNGACAFVAAFLHYLLLSAFLWMLVEAFLQYRGIVKVWSTHIEKFMIKACLICWGLPLIAIIVTVAIKPAFYLGRQKHGYCWLDLWMSYWVFLVPIGVILLTNFIVFFMVMWKLTHRPKNLTTNQSDSKRQIININAAIASVLLLGLGWVFGYLSMNPSTIVFAYLFTILNTLHGFFLFLFFTVRDKNVRENWRHLFKKKTIKKTSGLPPSDNRKASRPTLLTDLKEQENSSNDTSNVREGSSSYADSKSDDQTMTGSYDVETAFRKFSTGEEDTSSKMTEGPLSHNDVDINLSSFKTISFHSN